MIETHFRGGAPRVCGVRRPALSDGWVCGGRVSWELPSDSSEECSQAPGGERMDSNCSHASGEQDRKGNHRAGETKAGSAPLP